MSHPLYHHRIARGLTQKRLGELIGVKQQAIARWERGAGISLQHAFAIAIIFNDDQLKLLFPTIHYRASKQVKRANKKR